MSQNKMPLLLTLLSSGLVLSVLVNFYLILEQPATSTSFYVKGIDTMNSKTTANAFFEVGVSGYLDKHSPEEACQIADFKNQFCLQGYYFAKFRNLLTKSEHFEIPSTASEKYGLGQAYAFLNMTPAEDAAIIDGWAFSKALYDSKFFGELPDSCKNAGLKDTLVKYCYWGAGRAGAFLDDYLLERIRGIDKMSSLGLDFAQYLIGSKKVDVSSLKKDEITIESVSSSYISFGTKNSSTKELSCFRGRHPADCF